MAINNENIHGPVNITSYKQYILKDVLDDIKQIETNNKIKYPKR